MRKTIALRKTREARRLGRTTAGAASYHVEVALDPAWQRAHLRLVAFIQEPGQPLLAAAVIGCPRPAVGPRRPVSAGLQVDLSQAGAGPLRGPPRLPRVRQPSPCPRKTAFTSASRASNRATSSTNPSRPARPMASQRKSLASE